MKISVTVITKNEEANIERCLRSVPFADEIVVVDSGSDDRTMELARQFTDRVVFHKWEGHVRQKQYAVDIAAHDWILSLDADEEIGPPLAALIKAVKRDGPRHDAYTVRRKTHYLGKWIEHSGWYPDTRIRLFDRRRARWGGYDPHDEVVCDGTVGALAGDLLHYSYRDMAHHLRTINNYTSIMADRFYEKGKRASIADLLFRPPYAFVKKYFFQLGLLDGAHGLIVCLLSAYYVFCKYAKLWEKQRNASQCAR